MLMRKHTLMREMMFFKTDSKANAYPNAIVDANANTKAEADDANAQSDAMADTVAYSDAKSGVDAGTHLKADANANAYHDDGI